MLKPASRETYEQAKTRIPEHDQKIHEVRIKGSFQYRKQYVFDEEGNLVGIHDDDGKFFVSERFA